MVRERACYFQRLAGLLAAHGARDYRTPPSSEVLRTVTVRPGESLKCALHSQTRTSSRQKSSEIVPNRFWMRRNNSQIFVTFGPSNTRSKGQPVGHLVFQILPAHFEDKNTCKMCIHSRDGVSVRGFRLGS